MGQKIKSREELVDACRKYLGTPFLHHGRCIKNGVDCGGMIICALRDLGYDPPDMTVYGREPARDGLREYLIRAIGEPVAKEEAIPGDVALIKFVHLPHHVAIVGDYKPSDKHLSLIHSYGEVGKVVEHIYDKSWQEKTLEVYRFPLL